MLNIYHRYLVLTNDGRQASHSVRSGPTLLVLAPTLAREHGGALVNMHQIDTQT